MYFKYFSSNGLYTVVVVRHPLRAINWLTPPDSGTVKLEGKIIGSENGKLNIEQPNY